MSEPTVKRCGATLDPRSLFNVNLQLCPPINSSPGTILGSRARNVGATFVAAVLSMVAVTASFAEDPPDFWTTPAIQGYGKIHYLPGAAYKPQAEETYKVVLALSQAAKSPTEVNGALDHVARLVNLYTASGVPVSHLKFVAVAYGAATPLVLNDTQYRAAFGVANPNLPMIEKLRAVGVDIAVCGQAVAEHHYQYDWVDKTVTLSLSAMTTITTLEKQGYGLVQM